MSRRLALSLLALAGLAPFATARAQSVLLRIHPKAGDTLYMRLDQQVEVTGTTKVAGADSSVTVRSSITLHARTIVQRHDVGGTTVLSITDSVNLVSTPPQLPPSMVEQVERALRGQQVRMRIAPDGGAELLSDPTDIQPEIQALITQMPPTLPERSIAVGERWTHEMNLPAPGRPGLAGPVSLKATFRLDSLARRGRTAWISMRGELTHSADSADLPGGARHSMSGSMDGYLVVDQDRAWTTEFVSTLSVRSVIEPPPGAEGEPMRIRMRITQRLRTLDNR